MKGARQEDIAFITRMVEWDSHNHIILTWLCSTLFLPSSIYWATLMMQNLHGIYWPNITPPLTDP